MRIGIDLGGTKIEGILMMPDGTVTMRERVATPRNYPGVLDAIADLVALLDGEAGEAPKVGVAMPGSISPATGLVRNANSTWMNGEAFDRDLIGRLGARVRVANDADCFALSEATDGAAAGAASVFGVIIGTGVGGAVVLDGRLVSGVNGITGEWGHNPLPWQSDDEHPGPKCWCGRLACLETWLSGPALVADHERVTNEVDTVPTLVQRAAMEDGVAAATLERYADRLARGLATIVNVLDPEIIVLGGGVSNIPDLPAAVEGRLPAYVFSDSVQTRVVRNLHGDSSGVRGAAWLWPMRPAG